MNLTSFAASCLTVIALSIPGFAQVPEPLPEHAVLKMDAGQWEAEVTMWMGEGEPETVKGIETNRMMGEFWTISDFKGEFAGMPFEGHGTMGFDPETKKYVGSWIDTMSANAMHMSGTYDSAKKTLTFETKGIGMDGKPEVGKSTVVYHSKDRRTMTAFKKMPGSDEWTKSMEIKYVLRPAKETGAK